MALSVAIYSFSSIEEAARDASEMKREGWDGPSSSSNSFSCFTFRFRIFIFLCYQVGHCSDLR